MILKTKEFKEVADKILVAANLDKRATNLELKAGEPGDASLYLNVTNSEYYVSVKLALDPETPYESLHAVVNASAFLGLISLISAETFDIYVENNSLIVKANKSSYKFPMIYNDGNLLTLAKIALEDEDVNVSMNISKDILESILNVNSKELTKLRGKNVSANELQHLYFVDETGCFTFTTGACLNFFKLEKPVQMLLNERIVKLFKLFSTDVAFKIGPALVDGAPVTVATFVTDDIYMAAAFNNDDSLINKIKGPCTATKNYIAEQYSQSLVLNVADMSEALSRLILMAKNTDVNYNQAAVYAAAHIENNVVTITDKFGNTETVKAEGESVSDGAYDMYVSVSDLKLALDGYSLDHVTLKCGNHKSIILVCGNVSNIIPEVRTAAN